MSKKRSRELPTRDEQAFLRETNILMKTNLSKLKIDEMLGEVKAAEGIADSSLGKWLEKVKTLLISSSSGNGVTVTQAWLKSHHVSALSLENHKGGESSIDFLAPSEVKIGGSYSLKTQTKPLLNVDVLVTIPDECFDAKDILNHQYFDKRKLYVGMIAHIMNESGLCKGISSSDSSSSGSSSSSSGNSGSSSSSSGVTFAYLKGDTRKPIVVLRSKLKASHVVRIIPVISGNQFKLNQLRPTKNNVRPKSWIHAKDTNKQKGGGEKEIGLLSTPDYNMAIIEDIAQIQQLELLQSVSEKSTAFADTAVLLKIWLQQKGFRNSFDSIDSHTITLLLVHVMETCSGAAKMSPLALFQVFIKFLMDYDFSETNAVFGNMLELSEEEKSNSENSGSSSHLAYPIFNSSGDRILMNIMWRVSETAMKEMKMEATTALSTLQRFPEKVYELLFTSKASFIHRYDLYYSVPVSLFSKKDLLQNAASGITDDEFASVLQGAEEEMNESLCNTTLLSYLSQKVLSIAFRALGDRVVSIRILPEYLTSPSSLSSSSSDKKLGCHYPEFPTTTATSITMSTPHILIGIVLDKDLCRRRVERGPAVDEHESAVEFEQFWGPSRSELRRFQDGAIIHSVVWGQDNMSLAGQDIIDECLRHALGRHLPYQCGRGGNLLKTFGYSLESSLPSTIRDTTALGIRKQFGADELCRSAIKAFDTVRSILISKLDGMPLVIDSVMASSSMLRYTALVPPCPHALLLQKQQRNWTGQQVSLIQPPIKLVATLESSSKWPDEPEVAQRLVTAFLLQMSSLLQRQASITSSVHTDSLDIFHEGYIFRLEITTRGQQDSWQYKDADNINFETKERSLKPIHHTNVHSMYAQFPSYGNATRLLQYWVSSSMFTGHLSNELVELIVAHVYIHPKFGRAPTSAQAGFRSALQLLSEWDWNGNPMVVNFSGDLKPDEFLQINEQFEHARSTDSSALSMYIVSSYDRLSEFLPFFAENGCPERVVLRMICSAASETSALLDTCITERLIGSDISIQMDKIIAKSRVASNFNLVLKFNKSLSYSINSKEQTEESGTEPGQRWASAVEKGPSFARIKLFANLSASEASIGRIICR